MNQGDLDSEAKKQGKALGQHIGSLLNNGLAELVVGAGNELSGPTVSQRLHQLEIDYQALKQQTSNLGLSQLAQASDQVGGSASEGSDSGSSAVPVQDSDGEVISLTSESVVSLKARVVRLDS